MLRLLVVLVIGLAPACERDAPASVPPPAPVPRAGLDEVPEPPRTARIRGRVLGLDGAPLSRFAVQAFFRFKSDTLEPAGATVQLEAAAGGAFELDALPPGPLVVVAVATGSAPTLGTPFEARADATVECGDVRLVRGGGLTARVVDSLDTPLVGMSVEVMPDVLFPGVSLLGPARAVTDSDGRFALETLTPGRVVATVRAPGLAVGRVRAVVTDGEHVELAPLRLTVGTTITGAVRDADGRLVPGASVQLTPADQAELSGHRMARTDDAGRFSIAHVVPGTYELTASRASEDPFASIGDMRASKREAVVTEDDEALELDLAIKRR